MLDSAIHRLYQAGVLKACEENQMITSYSYEYMGRLALQPVTVDPRMKAIDLIRIVDRACSGSLQDMVTLSHLYNVGYGVPHDETAAAAWINHSCVSPADVSFDESCKKARKHVRNLPEEILPDPLTYPCMTIIDQIHDHSHGGKLRQGSYVVPRLKGIRVYLIYRHVPGHTPHLYAGFYRDKEDTFIAIDKLIALGAPRSFGEIRNRVTIKSYTPFGSNSMYVIAATIYVPQSLVEQSGAIGKNVHEIFNQFLSDDTIDRTRESFNVDFFAEELAVAEKELANAQRRADRFTEKGQIMPPSVRVGLRTAKERVATLKRDIAAANPQKEYEDYLRTRPRTYLRFIAHEFYRWNRRELIAVEMTRQMQSHLQSLGFTSVSHPMLEFAGYVAKSEDIPETVKVFEKALDAKVEALIIQPGPKSTVRFVDVTRIDV